MKTFWKWKIAECLLVLRDQGQGGVRGVDMVIKGQHRDHRGLRSVQYLD